MTHPQRNTGRLDDIFASAAITAIDDLEIAAHALTTGETTQNWTLHDLDRVRRVVSKVDAIGARVERTIEKRGPYPTGTGVSGA